LKILQILVHEFFSMTIYFVYIHFIGHKHPKSINIYMQLLEIYRFLNFGIQKNIESKDRYTLRSYRWSFIHTLK